MSERTWTLKLVCPWCRMESIWVTAVDAPPAVREERVAALQRRDALTWCSHCGRWCHFGHVGWLWEEGPPLRLVDEIAREIAPR